MGGALTVGGDLKFTDGGWDVNAAVGVTGTLTISGDAEVDVAGGVVTATAGVVITSTNDVDFEGTLITPVLNAASASGAISVDFDGNAAAVTALTGSGNDTIELDDAVVFTVNSGDGVDAITVTDVAAGTVINSAGGADTIDDNDDSVVFTVSTGATITFQLLRTQTPHMTPVTITTRLLSRRAITLTTRFCSRTWRRWSSPVVA